eukprot:scaffold1359_cov76-Cyclotella_meneghiniana.AAC.2
MLNYLQGGKFFIQRKSSSQAIIKEEREAGSDVGVGSRTIDKRTINNNVDRYVLLQLCLKEPQDPSELPRLVDLPHVRGQLCLKEPQDPSELPRLVDLPHAHV